MNNIDDVFENSVINHCINHNKLADAPYPESLNRIIDPGTIDQAVELIRQWPGYQATPLHTLKDLAKQTGTGMIHYKDEGHRFGLGSFKALGGAYAVMCLLQEQLSAGLGRVVNFEEVTSGEFADLISEITVTTATDGNHGRSVAWGAQQFGCQCVIYIHSEVSHYRQKVIEDFGAKVIRIQGNYDESVHMAAHCAEQNAWFVISDTSYEGYTDPPRNVMSGYCLMMDEVLHQLDGKADLTHVFIQGGVGGLAGAMNAFIWQKLGPAMPKIIIVEPVLADCLYQSAANGQATIVDISEETLMAGLSCGEVSQLGWTILNHGASDFLTIEDSLVAPTMKILASGDNKIVAGESAVAGLAALIACSKQPSLFSDLGLNASSQILVLGTEGATDPDIYQQLTGQMPS